MILTRRSFRTARPHGFGPRSHRLDRVPRKLNPALGTEQLQQDEHPLVRTQGSEQSNLILQRALQNPHAKARAAASAARQTRHVRET